MFDMERRVNQILWEYIMGDLGCTLDKTYENDTFIVKAYDWKLKAVRLLKQPTLNFMNIG